MKAAAFFVRVSKQIANVMRSYKFIILTGLAFLTISAFWQLYDYVIPLILKYSLSLGDTVNGVIMALDNIVAVVMLPLFGVISDKTNARMGRRKPYILYGTLAAVAFMMLIPLAAHTRQTWLFILGLGLVLISMATYRSPAVALMPDITPKPMRSKGNAVINLMGAVGGALILLINGFLAPDSKNPDTANYWPIFLTTAGIMLVGTIVLMFTVNEPKLVRKMREDSAAMGIDPEEAVETKTKARKPLSRGVRISLVLILISIFLWFMGYNAVTTAFSRYVTQPGFGMTEKQGSFVLMVAVISATLAFIPIGVISSRIGRKKSILGGITLLVLVFGTATLYKGPSPLMYVSFALAGIAWAAINVNSLPMVLEMSKGADVGKFTGFYYFASMAAQIVTPILSGALLEYGYTFLGSTDSFAGYIFLFPYAAIFIALAFVTMMFVRHGDSKPDAPKSKLEALNAGD